VIGEVTFGVIGLLFLFADLRTFSSTFQQTFYGAPTQTLGIMVVAVFATSFLGVIVAGALGPRRGLGMSGAVFGLATFLLTASRNNWTDLALSVVSLAGGMWWLAILHASRRGEVTSPLARALPLAFVADLALRAAFRTEAVVDLSWPVATGIALVAVLVFGAAGLASLGGERQWMGPGLGGALALAAVPSLILVAETGATNGAQVALAAGLGLGPEQARATQIGQLVLGLGLAAGVLGLTRVAVSRFVAAGTLAIGAALLWSHLPFVALVGGFVLAAGAVLCATAMLGAPLHPARSAAGVVLALSLGWLLFVGTAFGFYALWAYLPAVWTATAIVALATLVAPRSAVRIGRAVAVAVSALVIATTLVAFVATPVPPDPEPDRVTFRFMTYNIHQGFDVGEIPSLDAIVDTIDRERPDVLVLQEVVRGWMIDEQHDALSVLAERLGMRYVFQPNIGDLYGNAVLSRFPLEVTKRVAFAPPETLKHQQRGALFVRTGGVLVIVTHLDDIADSSIVRQEQMRTILREWNNESPNHTPAIVAGDLNGQPGDIEIRLLDQEGFLDLAQSAGPTTTGEEPGKRIDYVWGIGVVGAQAHVTQAPFASDHRGMVVNITRSGR